MTTSGPCPPIRRCCSCAEAPADPDRGDRRSGGLDPVYTRSRRLGGVPGTGPHPHHPAQQPREMETAQIGHGIPGPDHRHAAQIQPAEGLDRLAAQARQEVAGHPPASLHRRTGHARQGAAIGGVGVGAEISDRPNLRMTWNRKVGLHHEPTTAIQRGQPSPPPRGASWPQPPHFQPYGVSAGRWITVPTVAPCASQPLQTGPN